ncbi:hypothetical protein TOPH_07514 [Tolypocladium ophioglossoides CBS 100239]|uniref:Secretory phospholipase A2 n=1 Tax=Tolypocladium ophioglossoides (strain CBS 100239) TaxID=1163406 RepID=A0A0L0N1L4_TOLOC|nr:hypothetical protein TOPH_07514 [Tolypocladium ophioglossoides CBS 100239]
MQHQILTSVAVLAAAASALPTATIKESEASQAALVSRAELESAATGVCTEDATDTLAFEAPMVSFLAQRAAKDPAGCDWSTDNCSYSPDRPYGYDFVPSCQRHDFAYRNAKAQGRFTRAIKERADDMFRKDLHEHCLTLAEDSSKRHCRRTADLYVWVAKTLGKRDDGEALEEDDEDGDTPPGTLRDIYGFELDPDIPGQVIPEVHLRGRGRGGRGGQGGPG